jgi:hypothetical protein
VSAVAYWNVHNSGGSVTVGLGRMDLWRFESLSFGLLCIAAEERRMGTVALGKGRGVV